MYNLIAGPLFAVPVDVFEPVESISFWTEGETDRKTRIHNGLFLPYSALFCLLIEL